MNTLRLLSARFTAFSLFLLFLVFLLVPTGVQAGKYGIQAFSYPTGTVPGQGTWLDGTTLSSSIVGTLTNVFVASVRSNALRLTADGVTNIVSSFKIPDLDPGQDISAFNSTFTVRMQSTGVAGEGWSFNFGSIPPGDGDGEEGYTLTRGLVVAWDSVVDPSGNAGEGQVVVYANRIQIASYPVVFTNDATFRPVSLRWDVTGLDITFAGRTLVTDLPTPGVVASIGDTFAISARTGESTSQDVSIDQFQITTTPSTAINTGGPIISEFVADNGGSLDDEDFQSPDWVEIYNGGVATNLAGWFLTNDATNRTKWKFPNTAMKTNQYRVVFASGKDYTDTNGLYHLNFTLQKEGGYLALIRPDLSVASEYNYGPQKKDVAYGEIGSGRTVGYLDTPTPGLKNVSLVANGPPAEKVVFSREGGLLTGGSAVTLSIARPAQVGAVVRYTLNNTLPNSTSPIYDTPFTITNTVAIRARVFVDGQLPGPVESRTFLRLDASLTNYAGSGQLFSSSLPVLVIDSFGAEVDGVTDPGSKRPFRPSYAVMIDKDPISGRASLDAVPDYQGRSGFHVRGESSSGFPQKSYAWETWDESDADKDVSILGLPSESDWVLHGPWSDKTMMRNYLVHSIMQDTSAEYRGSRTQFVEVFFNQERNQPVSYADYRGVYLLVERIKVSKNRVNISRLNALGNDTNHISGGYIFKTDKASVGSVQWNTSQGISIQSYDPEALSSPQTKYLQGWLNEYEKVLASANFSNPQTGYAAYLNVPSFIDAMWWVEITKQIDGYVFSTYYHKDRNGKMTAGPIWDFNIALGNADYGAGDTPIGWNYQSTTTPLAGGLWYPRLLADPNYRVQTFDRYWQLRHAGWSTESLMARIDSVVAQLTENNPALISNTTPASIQSPIARHFRKHQILGVYWWPNPAGVEKRKTFQSEIDYMKKWLRDRFAWMDEQYSSGSAIFRPPILSLESGTVPAGSKLEIEPYTGTPPAGSRYPAGRIYYTTDGTDPRPSGFAFPVTQEATLIPEYSAAQYFVPTASNGGAQVSFADWTATTLGPSASGLPWTSGKLGFGFDNSASVLYPHIGGSALSNAFGNVSTAMLSNSAAIYIRAPFNLTEAQVSQISAFKLRMRVDDGFVAYLNGTEVARFNVKSNTVPAYDSYADAVPRTWRDTDSVTQRDFNFGAGNLALRAGENVLAILGLNTNLNDDDALFSPRLNATLIIPPSTPISAREYTEPLTLNTSVTIKARMFAEGVWSPLSEATYSVGALPASSANLVVSELMYQPAPPNVAESRVSSRTSDYEFVELLNISPYEVNIAGVRLTNAVQFRFGVGTPGAQNLAPGGRVVLCANVNAFQARYGTSPSIRLAGSFTDNLNNDGELFTLLAADGQVIQRFTYSNLAPWPTNANGTGYSIVLKNPSSTPPPNPNDGNQWRSSTDINGKPGLPDLTPLSIDSIAKFSWPEEVPLLLPIHVTGGAEQTEQLVYALGANPPAGVSITSSGVIRWRPTEQQGPGTYTIPLMVTDPSTSQSAVSQIVVEVLDANQPPSFTLPFTHYIRAGERLTFQTATDRDVPTQKLSFLLGAEAPASATIQPSTGQVDWIPADSDANLDHVLPVIVSDSGVPSLTAVQLYQVRVYPASTTLLVVDASLDRVEGRVVLTWKAVANATYQVEYMDALQGVWLSSNVLPVINAGLATFRDPEGIKLGKQRFYRVKQL